MSTGFLIFIKYRLYRARIRRVEVLNAYFPYKSHVRYTFPPERSPALPIKGVKREYKRVEGEYRRVEGEHRRVEGEHINETGVSGGAKRRYLSQQSVTCWPGFGETIYIYTTVHSTIPIISKRM